MNFGLPRKDAAESWKDREAFKAAGLGCHMLIISVPKEATNMDFFRYTIRVMLPSGYVADVSNKQVELL